MAVHGSHFETVDGITLDNLVRRFRSAEKDLRARVARRTAQLESASLRLSDPLYQRLYFIHRDLKEQRAAAEAELARRTGTRTSTEEMSVTARNTDRAERALDAALEMTFPASDPIAVRGP